MIKSLFKIFGGGSDSSAGAAVQETTAPGGIRDLEHFVDYVVRALVDYPDQVRITAEPGEDGSIIKIDCNKEDIGKVVGKRGKTIMAIRSLVSGAAGRLKERVSVEVID